MKFLLKFLLPLFVVLLAPMFSIFKNSKQEATDKVLIGLLKPHAVYNDDFVRDTLYTWTTDQQIKELKTNKILLTKSKSETKGYSLFDLAIRDSSLTKNSIARILQEEQFAKKRFAWVNGWATIMGWEGEKYGDQLIKIVLRNEAITGSFNKNDTQTPFKFFDHSGKQLDLDYVVKNKNRIAVIYHVNTKTGMRTQHRWTFQSGSKFSESTIDFREYVIINESMVKEWSCGTVEIKNELKKETGLLKQLSAGKNYSQTYYTSYSNSYASFNKEDENNDVSRYFIAMKCFNNDYYLLNNKRLNAIIKKLQQVQRGQSLPSLKKYDTYNPAPTGN